MNIIILSILVTVGAANPTPGLMDGIVNGMVGGVANKVVGNLADTAAHLLNGGMGEMGHGGHNHLNLPLKDLVGHVKDMLGIQQIHGTDYCSCPKEESYMNYHNNYPNYEKSPQSMGGYGNMYRENY